MSDAGRNPDDYCYRHPDRLSFVLCERCGRTICLECQTSLGGKVLCPDDYKVIPITRPVHTSTRRAPRLVIPVGMPVATYALMALLLLVFLADTFANGFVQGAMMFVPGTFTHRPWTLVTSMFAEGGGSNGILSLIFDGVVLYFAGRRFEEHFGHLKFIVLYLVSGLGASVFALIFGGVVVSAGSALFGLIVAILILLRKMGGNLIWIYVSVGITVLELVLSPARALLWQAALGAALAGAAVAFGYLFEGTPVQARRQRLLIAGAAGLLVALAAVKVLAIPGAS